jgi:hypothetical protein
VTDLNADAAEEGSILIRKRKSEVGIAKCTVLYCQVYCPVLPSVLSCIAVPSMEKYKFCNASHIIQMLHYLSHAATLVFPSFALCLVKIGHWVR